jgi:cytoskeletal protein CcmA (bactofilin family)
MNHAPERSEVNAFLGGETTFEGTLHYSGAVRLDGRFKGTIASSDLLIVGETARIEGDIQVGTVVVRGEIKGTITATERVELYHPGKILGDIATATLLIDDGAIFEGNCRMKGLHENKIQKTEASHARKPDTPPKTDVPAESDHDKT